MRPALANAPDLILLNGKIFTADPAQRYVEAIAIRGEHILAVGASTEVAALADSQTRHIDLQGHVVIPGINDTHYHFHPMSPGGHHLSFQSLEPSWQETQDMLAAATKTVPAGTWIFGVVGGIVVREPSGKK